MKDLNMLVWLTQLGLTVALPLGGFALLGFWLKNRFGLGTWVVLVCCAVGLISAVDGLIRTLKMLARQDSKKDKTERGISFNDHE